MERVKKCGVIMIPTKDVRLITPPLFIDSLANSRGVKHLVYNRDSNVYFSDCEYQDLFVTSNDSIQEGDYYLDDCWELRIALTSDKDYWAVRQNYRKVIATTMGLGDDMPNIPHSFLLNYAVRYNSGDLITDIRVVYTYAHPSFSHDSNDYLKVEKGVIVIDSIIEECDDWLMLPPALTAELGHKSLLSGEFNEKMKVDCDMCNGGEDAHNEDCICEGEGQYDINVPVSWTTIKNIYKKIVEFHKNNK